MKAWEEIDSLAERIRLVMEERGLKQADLVRRTGLAPSTMSQILSGDRGAQGGITHITVLKLKKVLGVPYSFFDLESARKSKPARDAGVAEAQYVEA